MYSQSLGALALLDVLDGLLGAATSYLASYHATRPVRSVPCESECLFRTLRGALHRLVSEGQIDPADVVVLTQARALKDRLVGQQLAGLVLESTDERDAGVLVETIHRFKGLEAAAAIVVLDRLETDRDRALAYIGLSRPRVHLSVVGPADLVSALG